VSAPWRNADPSTYQEEGPLAAPDWLRLPRPRFMVSDLGLRPVEDPDQDPEDRRYLGPRALPGVSLHQVDAHAGYVAAQEELERRGYHIASQHRDGEGRLVLRWARVYERWETLSLDRIRLDVELWRSRARREPNVLQPYSQAVLRFDRLAPKAGEREAYRQAKPQPRTAPAGAQQGGPTP